MEQGVITKQKLNELLSAVSNKANVYIPVKKEKTVEFEKYTGSETPTFDYINPQLSVKGFFFPQREVLCRFEDGELKEVPMDEESSVIFGVRPCDAQALIYLDKVFGDATGRFKDPYYLTRRQNSLVITLHCNEPAETCFCTSVNGDPAGKEGSDVAVVDLGDTLLFEAVSEKGASFMKEQQSFFTGPTKEETAEKEKRAEQAREQLKKNAIRIEGIKEKLDKEFDDEDWARVTANCLGCGACTYLCPTCHCFDITDEKNKYEQGIRLRSWDSCQYPLFTKHASGHNPRVNKTQRMRQRIMHKFSYTVDKTGDIYCVGCGRCISNCPVNLDIRDILNTFVKK